MRRNGLGGGMQDFSRVRHQFPILSDLTYLNTASMGLVPTAVTTAAHDFEADLCRRGTTGFDEASEIAVYETARQGAARLFNAPGKAIAVASSTTEALCQVAWWLRPSAPANVVSTDVDFPSNTYPWYRIGQDTGVELRLVPVLEDPEQFGVETIARYVDANTAVVNVSHVQFLTGHRLDLAELAELAHTHDALLIVDASQSAGQVPIDVVGDNVDVLVCGSYKFLCSTFGAALCYLRPELLERFNPPFVGWRSAPDPYALASRWQGLAKDARRMEFSTMSYAAAVALGRAIEFLLDLEPSAVLEHNLALSERLIDGLTNLGAQLLTPRQPDQRAGSVTARFPGHDSEHLAARLNERGIIVSPRVGSARYSAHFYNTADDIDAALAATGELLKE
jgi:cysteine desulfurase / selenocysteine lyase